MRVSKESEQKPYLRSGIMFGAKFSPRKNGKCLIIYIEGEDVTYTKFFPSEPGVGKIDLEDIFPRMDESTVWGVLTDELVCDNTFIAKLKQGKLRTALQLKREEIRTKTKPTTSHFSPATWSERDAAKLPGNPHFQFIFTSDQTDRLRQSLKKFRFNKNLPLLTKAVNQALDSRRVDPALVEELKMKNLLFDNDPDGWYRMCYLFPGERWLLEYLLEDSAGKTIALGYLGFNEDRNLVSIDRRVPRPPDGEQLLYRNPEGQWRCNQDVRNETFYLS